MASAAVGRANKKSRGFGIFSIVRAHPRRVDFFCVKVFVFTAAIVLLRWAQHAPHERTSYLKLKVSTTIVKPNN